MQRLQDKLGKVKADNERVTCCPGLKNFCPNMFLLRNDLNQATIGHQ